MSNCQGCGQDISWTQSSRGKWIPLDATFLYVTKAKVSTQKATVVDSQGIVVTGWVVADGDARLFPDAVRGRVSHFASCPKASEFRRPR